MATQNAIDIPFTLTVANGGTGRTTLTNHSVLVGAGTSAITQLTVGTSGQLLIASSGADPVFATPTSTAGSITYTTGAGTLNLDVVNYANKTSFTPGLAFGGAATGITYTTQTATYTRIGSIVFVMGTIVLSSFGSASGSATITGLPFTSNSSQTYILDFDLQNINSSTTNAGFIGQTSNSTTITLYRQGNASSGAGLTNLTNTAFSNNSQVNFFGTYLV